jgi:uncharacterized protein (TIGR02598 family)
MNRQPDNACQARHAPGGFSLVEVTLAIGVAGFCLVTIFALLPIGLISNRTALAQTVAANLTSSIVSDLNCTQPLATGTATTPRFGFPVPAAGSTVNINTPYTIYLTANGSATGTVGAPPVTGGTGASIYRATLGFAPPAGGQRTATAVRILITWPALADSKPGTWPQNYAGSYESDTTLNRN